MILRWALLPLIALTPVADAQVRNGPACRLSTGDAVWLDGAMRAWNYTSANISGIARIANIQAVFFDGRCVVTSTTAMNGGPARWAARPHAGEIVLPDGAKIPAGVISFASGGEGKSYFVMSTPSLWRAAVKSDNGLGSLEMLMTAVVLHEGHHVAQIPTYGKRIGALSARHRLPEDFNDDSIQKQFEPNREFKESIGRETDLLLSAATARDRAAAIRLASEARDLMRARQQRWYTGKDSYLTEAEDIWLTFEGSAQWVAHQWLVDANGGAVDPRAAFGSFAWRGKWWSQNQGFAVFMALDRIGGSGWRRHAFGDGAKTALQMLDEALAGPPAAIS